MNLVDWYEVEVTNSKVVDVGMYAVIDVKPDK